MNSNEDAARALKEGRGDIKLRKREGIPGTRHRRCEGLVNGVPGVLSGRLSHDATGSGSTKAGSSKARPEFKCGVCRGLLCDGVGVGSSASQFPLL